LTIAQRLFLFRKSVVLAQCLKMTLVLSGHDQIPELLKSFRPIQKVEEIGMTVLTTLTFSSLSAIDARLPPHSSHFLCAFGQVLGLL
jgi:hypothetical protein